MKDLLSILLTCCSLIGWSQSVLDQKVDFKVENVSIETALFELLDQTDIEISFSNNILPKNNRVNIDVRNTSIRSILNRILRDTNIVYKISC